MEFSIHKSLFLYKGGSKMKQKTNHQWYTSSLSEVTERLKTRESGLTQQEVEQRYAQYGLNELVASKKVTWWQRLFNQFKDVMILVLMVAALLSFFMGDKTEAIMILCVVFLMAIFGVFQESKAEQAIDALKDMSSPKARVKRGGDVLEIDSRTLVPGDFVFLEAGDIVPADIRLITAASLKVEESGLTGESVPVEKEATAQLSQDTPIGDRLNMLYMNSSITYGRATGYVVATGMDTEVGHIAALLSDTKENETPLKQNLNHLGKTLTGVILVICVIMFFIGWLSGQKSWIEMLLTAVSLAVAAIPEGLPAIVTIILALGTQKMAQRHAIIRKLPAVETLGSTEIICSDKTGTLTMNEMTIEALYRCDHQDDVSLFSMHPPFYTLFLLCNDTKQDDTGDFLGDPTETAFYKYVSQYNDEVKALDKAYPRIAELPFDSDRKRMTTVHQTQDQGYLVATKGAPDVLLDLCQWTLNSQGDIVPMTDALREEFETLNASWAQQAFRVLAAAYQYVDKLPETLSDVEKGLIFVGFAGMIDPEREEAKAAVLEAKAAGIRPIMITGDHPVTARTIAMRLHILSKDQQEEGVITGAQLDQLSDQAFDQCVTEYSVYARVSPAHKVRIVKAWQDQHKIVAMTGDGVNDAPALKAADIGIGMGITGTEVSKSASDMVLADDNFSTIIVAVKEGRKVFSNIQKTVQYLLSANLGEVLTVFLATLFHWDTLLPIHLLWINVVTDTFPAIALGVDPADDQIMEQPPRGKSSNFLSGGVRSSIIYQGILEAAITLGVYASAIIWPVHETYEAIHADALTMAYVTLGLLQLFHAFNVKSVHQSILTRKTFENKWFNGAIFLSFVLLAATVVVPGLNDIFSVAHLDTHQWLIVVLASFSIIPIVELIKWGQRMFLK